LNPAGSSLELGEVSLVSDENPDVPQLVVSGGRHDGLSNQRGGPGGERIIGTGPEAHFRIPGKGVAAIHAHLKWSQEGVFIYDEGTAAGTFVNGEKIEDSWIDDGDRIFLGAPGAPDSVKIIVKLPAHPSFFPPVEAPPTEAGAAAQRTAHAEDFMDAPSISVGGAPRARGGPMLPKAAPPEKPPVARMAIVAGVTLLVAIVAFVMLRRSALPGPLLSSLTPPQAEPGQTIQISGGGFDGEPESNEVRFGALKAEVTAAGDGQLSVVVPKDIPVKDDKAQHQVVVTVGGRASNSLFFKVYNGPRITALEPDVALAGAEVKAVGENLGADAAVAVAGASAEVLEATPSFVRFKVPETGLPQGKRAGVQVRAGGYSARLVHLIIGRLPLVLELSPAQGMPGDKVTLKGRGFDPAFTIVRFGGRAALVLSATEAEATVVVPGARVAGAPDLPVVVEVRGTTSAPSSFRINRPSAADFAPRFFAEPAGEGRALVSSEIGPLLLLGEQGDQASVSARAVALAEALNRTLAEARKAPVAIEQRDTAVGVAGQPPLASVLPGDAAAYQSPPLGVKGSRASPRAIARLWAALLHDELSLFGQKQRPNRVLEITPRGRAIVDLFAAAERRAGNLAPAMVDAYLTSNAQALAEMALMVPSEGETTTGAAIAGRWEGRIEETGMAPRKVLVFLRQQGGGLEGSISMRSGSISGEVPLTDASYAGGTLRFRAEFGATPWQFTGKLEGKLVSGTVAGAGGREIGRFNLSWIE
jgi:hypothetical protein